MFVRVICPVCRLNRRVDDRQLPLGVACPKCPDTYMDLDPKSLPPIEVTPSVLTRRGRGFAVHPSIRVASLWDRFLGALIDAALGLAVALPGLAILLAGGSAAASLGWMVYAIGVGFLALVNLVLLIARGQTVGKWWVETYYARSATGEPAGILRLIVLRSLPYIPLYVAYLLLLQGPPWALLLVVGLLCLLVVADFLVMLLVPTHRRIVDYVAGTVVARE
jgi:uncharacterized RDD family membrane protein YckC